MDAQHNPPLGQFRARRDHHNLTVQSGLAPEVSLLATPPQEIARLLGADAPVFSFLNFFERQSRRRLVLLGLFLVGGIGLIKHWTGSEIVFSIFYLVPIGLGAWCGGMRTGVVLSLASVVVGYAVDALDQHIDRPLVLLWNAGAGLVFFLTTSYLLDRLRMALLRERVLARIDYLTGAATRWAFYNVANHELERARRKGQPLTVAFMDLDNFKEINDRLGHLTGDDLLCRFVEVIRQKVRSSDVLGRIGGDEFALLLPETGADGAKVLLVKLHELLRDALQEKGWTVTVSIGVVTFLAPPKDVDSLIRHADALMYQAKRAGKDRLCFLVAQDGEVRASTTQT